MEERIKKWLADHSITTHSVAAAFVTLSILYAQVPQFHDLVLSLYNAIPGKGQNVVATALAVYAWYRRGYLGDGK